MLWVADVGVDDSVEGEAMGLSLLAELNAILLGLDSEFTTDGVLDFEEGRVDGIEGEGAHCGLDGSGMQNGS